ncbi:MAG: hypothetical protein EP307_11355 [Rhodobacteraceae bacterium]|nr:MAG: hypothetical protein EP307_11355 [Paracoccaceae bacterium]
MTWIGLHDGETGLFDRAGLDRAGPDVPARDRGAELSQGSLMIETRAPSLSRPHALVRFEGRRGLQIALQSLPGGGLTLVVAQGEALQHATINHSETGRTDVLRVTFSWGPGLARVAAERTDGLATSLHGMAAMPPFALDDLRAMFQDPGRLHLTEDVVFLALSDRIEATGPMPGLHPDTPVATPQGYRPVGRLRRGDTVVTDGGHVVPVLHRIDRDLPGRGSFAPLRLRAPFFGLRRDIVVAPSQRLLLRGSEVEYLFGQEAVLVPASHLSGASAAGPVEAPPVMRYSQILLPDHEAIDAAGTIAESLFIGRLRRKPALLAASSLADFAEGALPDHGPPRHPVLRAFDAQVLADYRAA